MDKTYDLNGVADLTHQKTKHIIQHNGFFLSGFVLTREDGKKCIVDMGAVRWMDCDEFFKMMHPAE